MAVDWKRYAHLGVKIVGSIVPAVGLAEHLVSALGGGTGHAKQDSVVEAVQAALLHELGRLGPVLLFNTRVIAAMRSVIDAVVALNKVVAEEAAGGDPSA